METITLKGDVTTSDRRLDRVPEYDEQSRNFRVRTLLAARQPAQVRTTVARFPSDPSLDQGREGACVGFSIATMANASPVRRSGDEEMSDGTARLLYYEAQKIDPWPGGEYPGATPVYGGTSVLSGLKAAQQLGLIDSYYWCGAGSQTPGDDMIDSLMNVGAVILGIPWYESMFEPNDHGVLEVDPASGLPGYHAICAHTFRYGPLPGGSKRKKVEHIVLQNSWGEDWGTDWWGTGGHAFVEVEKVVDHLLPHEVQGECAVPIERAL